MSPPDDRATDGSPAPDGYGTGERGLDWLHRCLAQERAESGLAFNPLRPRFQRAREETYARLRDRSPVHYSRLLDCWIVTRYEDVDRLLRSETEFRSDPHPATQDVLDPYALLDPDRPSLFMLDPPDHTRLRAELLGALSPEAVRRLRLAMEACVRGVVDALGRPGDRVDLVPRFASAIPLRVLDLFTGLGLAEVADASRWIARITHGLEPVATTRTARAASTAYATLGARLDERLLRPAAPGTLHASLSRSVRRGRVTEAEARQLLMFLLLAGAQTLSDFLAGAVRELAALPGDAPERRQVDDALVAELFARISPVQIVARTAATPTVLRGRRIDAGQRLLLVLGSANRDLAGPPPADPVADGPARTRARPDLAFGRGIHRCPGARLAQWEARYALSYLLARHPGIRLTGAEAASRCVTLRGWDSVHVQL